jgi:hypothetical protein
MRESTADEMSMLRKLLAEAKDLEKSSKSVLSSVKFESAKKAATMSGMASSAPVRENPGPDTSADANRRLESGDPVCFFLLTEALSVGCGQGGKLRLASHHTSLRVVLRDNARRAKLIIT